MVKLTRILQVVGSLNCGGAETMIMNLYRNIDREQIQFDFVVHTELEGMYDNEVKQLGGKIFSCPKFSGKNFVEYCRWWQNFFQKHSEYRVLHSHIRSCAIIYFIIAKKYRIKTIIHSHSTSNGSGKSAVIKNIMQFPLRYEADCLMACSQKAGEWLYGKREVSSGKYIFLPNAVDVDRYKINERVRFLYRKNLTLENKLVFGHIGRFHESKNHSFLLKVFAEIYKRNPDARLLLIGDGELRKPIEDTIHQLGIDRAVILLGLRTDIAELFQAMDVILFPSVWEGFPVTVIEAQAAGVPCIISENITKEVDITKLVHRLPVTEVESWVNLALSGLKKQDVSNMVKKSGFDVKESAQKLLEIYKMMIGN